MGCNTRNVCRLGQRLSRCMRLRMKWMKEEMRGDKWQNKQTNEGTNEQTTDWVLEKWYGDIFSSLCHFFIVFGTTININITATTITINKNQNNSNNSNTASHRKRCSAKLTLNHNFYQTLVTVVCFKRQQRLPSSSPFHHPRHHHHHLSLSSTVLPASSVCSSHPASIVYEGNHPNVKQKPALWPDISCRRSVWKMIVIS